MIARSAKYPRSTSSNVGFDLPADALSTAAGKPYAELLHDQITGPLGMNDTGVYGSKYNLEMNSTGWEVSTIAHAIYRQRQSLQTAIGFDEAGPMFGIGLAWLTIAAHEDRPTIVAKSGGGGGFMTYIALAPGRDVGVFVAVNKVDFNMFAGMTTMANDLIANLVTR